jgi:hypothetical protein
MAALRPDADATTRASLGLRLRPRLLEPGIGQALDRAAQYPLAGPALASLSALTRH